MTDRAQGWVAFVVFIVVMMVWLRLEPTDTYYECETASGQYTTCVKHNN